MPPSVATPWPMEEGTITWVLLYLLQWCLILTPLLWAGTNLALGWCRFLATCGNRIHATISPEQCEGEKWHFLTPVLGTWPSFVLDSHFSKRGRHPTTFCLPKVFLLDFMFSSRIHQLLSRFCSLSRGKSKELLLVFDLVDNLKLVLFGIPAFMLTKMKLNLQVSFFFSLPV